MRNIQERINEEIFGFQPNAADDSARVCFIYDLEFVFFEQDRVILGELLTNLGLATAGVFVVALALLVHPVAALMVVVAVLCVDLFLFGELWIFSIKFNSVSVINLVMAVGLAADYAAHIIHKFLTVDGESRVERMTIAMSEIGQAVLQGGLTTMVSLIPLAFASSQVFQTFFAMLFGTALFGLGMGMVVIPILLLYIGPNKILAEEVPQAEASAG